jgi:hypothetical protein
MSRSTPLLVAAQNCDAEQQHRTTSSRTGRAMQNDFLFVVKRPVRGWGARASVTGPVVWPMVVVSVQGPGSDFAEEPLFRCEAATLATEPFLECPARPAVQLVTRFASVMRCRHTTSLSRRLNARIASRGVFPSASLRSW